MDSSSWRGTCLIVSSTCHHPRHHRLLIAFGWRRGLQWLFDCRRTACNGLLETAKRYPCEGRCTSSDGINTSLTFIATLFSLSWETSDGMLVFHVKSPSPRMFFSTRARPATELQMVDEDNKQIDLACVLLLSLLMCAWPTLPMLLPGFDFQIECRLVDPAEFSAGDCRPNRTPSVRRRMHPKPASELLARKDCLGRLISQSDL